MQQNRSKILKMVWNFYNRENKISRTINYYTMEKLLTYVLQLVNVCPNSQFRYFPFFLLKKTVLSDYDHLNGCQTFLHFQVKGRNLELIDKKNKRDSL